MSNILIESIFTETPFLTSDIGDNKELAKITNNYFFANKNKNRLINILRKIIEEHKHKKVKISLNYIKQKYKIKNVYNLYLEHYEN